MSGLSQTGRVPRLWGLRVEDRNQLVQTETSKDQR